MIAERQPTPVLYVACADELEEIRAAWDRLEAVVPLKGRRFYGAAFGDGTYWACSGRATSAGRSSSTTAAVTRLTCWCRSDAQQTRRAIAALGGHGSNAAAPSTRTRARPRASGAL